MGTRIGSAHSDPAPLTTYGFSAAQSVKTQYDREERGTDGGKKVKGHKRPIVVEILGNFRRLPPEERTGSESPC